jgi:lactate permease
MDLFFAAVPIAFLIFVMTKKNGLPSTVAFALAALLTYLVRISYFKTSPNLAHAAVVNGLLQALTPISIVFGAIPTASRGRLPSHKDRGESYADPESFSRSVLKL